MRIYLSAGEPSGDHLGASLARALAERAPDAVLEGYGSGEMRDAGVEIFFDLPAMAVMGFLPVIRHIPTLRRLYRETVAYLETQRPDAVVLIDYPGWHFVVAKAAKRLGIPVVQFVAPQLWAWAPWRIRKVRKRMDRVLVVLPFEEQYFKDRGVDARYVGHPLIDRLGKLAAALPPAEGASPSADGARLVGILPGSRTQEWEALLPLFLDVAKRLHADDDRLRFTVACAKEAHLDSMRAIVADAGFDCPVVHGETTRIQRDAALVLTSSGTATLECTYFRTPMVVAYPVKRTARYLSRYVVTAPYITLANLLAGRELVPEFLWAGEPADRITDAARRLLADGAARHACIEGLDHVRSSLVGIEPSANAADEILRLIDERRGATPSAVTG